MTGWSLFYVEKWPPVIIPRRIMTPSRRIMSPTRRINTRGVFIQRVGYRKMTPIEKWPPYIIVVPVKQNATNSTSEAESHLGITLPVVCLSVWYIFGLFIFFFTLRDRTFICGMCIHYDKTFPMVPYILSTWFWPLTYIWKTLTLHITFLP